MDMGLLYIRMFLDTSDSIGNDIASTSCMTILSPSIEMCILLITILRLLIEVLLALQLFLFKQYN